MSHPQRSGAAPGRASAARSGLAAAREGLRRVRTAATTTEPGRLRVIGAGLAALLLAFGAITAWQVSDRSAAADAVVGHSQPLSAAAADIYRSLADADTTAASGFLAGGKEPRAVRERYEKDIATASELLVKAAANADRASFEHTQITRLNQQLPAYTGLVESARANNRQGLPLGGAYLRYASDQMRLELLPAARKLYEAETGRLRADYRDAESWPWFALAAGVLTLGALGWAQHREYRRTNRVFSQGLLAATAATTVALLWLTAGHGVACADLSGSYAHGAKSMDVLHTARIASLQARGAENLTLVARGAVVTGDNHDAYEESYRLNMRQLAGDPAASAPVGGLLERARTLADGRGGRDPVSRAVGFAQQWRQRHQQERAVDDGGDYAKALPMVIGDRDSTGESFDRVDAQLQQALDHEQGEFRHSADDGRGALTGLAVGAAALALLGALGVVLGIGRRLSEYR
ncbi:hypothetical protein ACIHFE_00915 [Streptomyces sp. NPDC052396]|uniref:hypothetical protein n=1 Tax=Streptomyces sp. NPDC052396 TaxID=3365689 RepID=UPI0037D89005